MKVILICGKICSGKSYYSKSLKDKYNAVILSTDEVTFDLINNEQGEFYNIFAEKVNLYLRKKAVEICKAGANVILDWGFWTRDNRMIIYEGKSNMNYALTKVLQLPAWESMMKRILWKQLGDIKGKRILDFGSGIGKNACYFAQKNEVLAIEPDEKSVAERWTDYQYTQLIGSTEQLQKLESESFDIIICHNVFEYATDRDVIMTEFGRLIKKDGYISILKHNRMGRVMQTVTLLNNFEHAKSLLEGGDSYSEQYGVIHYYEDQDLIRWCDELEIVKILGMRTFWHMQQNQENHSDSQWQKQMIEMDLRVADIEEFKQIAFFHHIILKKKVGR